MQTVHRNMMDTKLEHIVEEDAQLIFNPYNYIITKIGYIYIKN